MKTVSVNASKAYTIKIGAGLLDLVGAEVSAMGNVEKVCIVSDNCVYSHFGQTVRLSLEKQGLTVTEFVFPQGEDSKNGNTFLSLLNALAQAQLTRSDMIIALGGGVVGDLAGFAAACYLRGIRLIQIPTTLLAAVDSSVGGKTAIDLPAGKNLAGAFYQPSLVLCDINALQTLPVDTFCDGCAEIIKYAVLFDPELFRQLQIHGISFDQEAVIARCVELKRDVVMEDEYDTGARMKLNLGHTIGHGIEAKSAFAVSHGKAVSIGMSIVSRSAASSGILPEETCNQIVSLLQKFQLPVCTEYTAEDLFRYTLSDKKRSGSQISLIVPRAIGNCDIVATPVDELKRFIEAGL